MSRVSYFVLLALFVACPFSPHGYCQDAPSSRRQSTPEAVREFQPTTNPFRNQAQRILRTDELPTNSQSPEQPPPKPPRAESTVNVAQETLPPATNNTAKVVDKVPTTSSDVVEKDAVDRRLAEVQENADLDEPTKSELVKRYKAAHDWLRQASEAHQKIAAYQVDVKDAPRLLAEAKQQLAQPAATATITAPANATLVQIEQLAAEAEAKFQVAQESLAAIELELHNRSGRKTELAKTVEETKQRLEEVRNQLKVPLTSEEATPQAHARRIETGARVQALESQLALYKMEAARHEAFADVLPAMRDVAKREKNQQESQVAEWQKIVIDFRKQESVKQAAEARIQVQNAHPALRSLAERNAALAEQRKALVDSVARVGKKAKEVEKQVEHLRLQYQKAEQRVRKAGHSSTVGLMLRRQKENLPRIAQCSQTLREIEVEMPKANLAQIEVEEEREALADIETVVPQFLEKLDASKIDRTKVQLEQTVRELLDTKQELLGSLATDYETYLDKLSDLEISNSKLAEQIKQSSSYINEHVLWIRSADPLWTNDIGAAAEGAIALASPESWLAVAKHCGLDTIQRPLPACGVLLVVGLIIGFHAKLRAKMVAVCSSAGGITLKFRPTLQAIGLAAIAATEWPLLLAYLGWRMSLDPSPEGLTSALGTALLSAAALLWVADFMKHVVRKDGLAESHLGWSAHSAKLFRSELRWLTLLGVPAAIVAIGMQQFQNGEWSNSLGRIAFIAGMLLQANFMHSIFNAKDNILREAISLDASNWLARLRQVSHAIGVGVPGVLAALAIAGYYYTSQQVALRWQATLGVSLTLLFAYSVASRWCLVKRRNLAVQQARERQRQAAGASVQDPNAVAPAIQIEDQQPDLSAIHEQLRYLLRHATIVGMLVCTWFIWADVLPALKILDRAVLWETVVEVTETRENPDGTIERTPVDRPVTTTLRHAIFALLLIAATFVIGRNLPALLEVTVLQRIPFDKGGRHAISVLLKYSVALAGVFLACRMLSFTWSSVQWLAAGMTVGLGFGLQEIFANFVSGLILLLERPIRVGDVITLGDVTGTVTNMKIRATTVTNWDRKELIVPNKDLITGRLLNWTLTDTTNRILITVGIAYHSDPQHARDLILQAVTSHANVLTEPAPNVTFEEFADSALNLVVRAYVANMEVRLATVHELHLAIHSTLRDAGIEIAFPQRDIHVRGLESIGLMQKSEPLRDAA